MELWRYVDGSHPEPDEKTSPEWATWRKWDRRASYYIANSISNKVLSNAGRTTVESLGCPTDGSWASHTPNSERS
jgi:hypothetical protein